MPCGRACMLSSVGGVGLFLIIWCVGAASRARIEIREESPAAESPVGVASRETPAESPSSLLSVEDRRPRYARVNGDVETLWQLPYSKPIQGIMFMAHGCNHQATDFFTNTGSDGWELAGCKTSNYAKFSGQPASGCLGLPEERQLVRSARHRGYLVLTTSGGSGVHSCWNMAVDPARIARAVQHVVQAEGLREDTPVFATGASSGGALMGALDQSGVLGTRLKCIVPQIMGLRLRKPTPTPALFVHMSRDQRTSRQVEQNIQQMKLNGARAEEIVVKPWSVASTLEGHYTQEETASIVDALKAGGLLNGAGFLQDDPRRSDWRTYVRNQAPRGDSLVADASPLAELLNVAWSFHEFTSQYSETMLDFCEGKSAGSA